MARVNETEDYDDSWEYDYYAEWSGLRLHATNREARGLTDAAYEGVEDSA